MLEQSKKLADYMTKLNIDEIVRKKITPFGSGSHIILPKKHSGKKAIVIIKDE